MSQSRWQNQLRHAAGIIELYDGRLPLSSWLKLFFKDNKQMGSRDRRQLADLAFGYFRLGKAVISKPVEDSILLGNFLTNHTADERLTALRPEWAAKISLPLKEKLVWLNDPSLHAGSIFPWMDALGEDIDHNEFGFSFLAQPHTYLRIRPGYKEHVRNVLQKENIAYQLLSEDCVQLPSGLSLDKMFVIDKEVVVQDYNSQRTELLFPDLSHIQHPEVWDACAGSGGKSLLWMDGHPNSNLTVTDIRDSILTNLHNRLSAAGIKNYRAGVADLAKGTGLPQQEFDVIIADVPCTGSGTWARTPEALSFFDHKKIESYHSLQQQILNNIVRCMHRNTKLVYITCSVFKEENESQLAWLEQHHQLPVIKSATLPGWNIGADTMFAALLSF